MTLIDYLLKEAKGLEADFILEYGDAIRSTTYDVIIGTETPFEKTKSFLEFALNILDGDDLPKGKERRKYFTWTKYIIDTTRLIEQAWYQQFLDDESDDMKDKSDSFLRVYTSKLSYEDIEQMSSEELWNLIDITIENDIIILSNFLRKHKKELFGGDDSSEFNNLEENLSKIKEGKIIKDHSADISSFLVHHENLYENLKRIANSK